MPKSKHRKKQIQKSRQRTQARKQELKNIEKEHKARLQEAYHEYLEKMKNTAPPKIDLEQGQFLEKQPLKIE